MASAQSRRPKEAAVVAAASEEADEERKAGADNFGVDVDDLTDETESEDEEDCAEAEEEESVLAAGDKSGQPELNHVDIQEQLAAAGPAGVAAAAAIATARKRKRSHSFETNPSVRKRQQTRLIRKLRACLDEYTMRVGQQAVVLITMPGKAVHNFKVFGAQPLESVIRACKAEIMGELEQALLEQAPQQFKEDTSKHELPALVIDGIPTPVEKMTQAQLRAFIPLMLKYSTGRGKPGWGKDSTRPPWWPETLPWANVRSDARDEAEKQRVSWTTTLRQIVTNCYKFHGRDDLLPTFDEADAEASRAAEEAAAAASGGVGVAGLGGRRPPVGGRAGQQAQANAATTTTAANAVYAQQYAGNFVHALSQEGTVSLIQVDPANAQILTLPDGTQVRAVRLQTLGAEALCGQALSELPEAEAGAQVNLAELAAEGAQTVTMSEATVGPEGQIIVTGEDGVQSCYPMSSLVSIPASVYQQFAAGGQQLSIMTADGAQLAGHTLSLHALPAQGELVEQGAQKQQQQQQQVHQESEAGPPEGAAAAAAESQ